MAHIRLHVCGSSCQHADRVGPRRRRHAAPLGDLTCVEPLITDPNDCLPNDGADGHFATPEPRAYPRVGRRPHVLPCRACSGELLFSRSILARDWSGELAGASVLDVGCGVGHLYDLLTSRDVRIDYTGYDIAPAVVEAARRRLPHVEIQILDIVATDVGRAQFDFVVVSGLFSLRRVRPYAYVGAVAHRMHALCRRGVALNCLSSVG